jgi:peroxiredoxin
VTLRWGQAAPDFTLPGASGQPVSLSEFKGKAVVVLGFYCYDFGGI